MAEKNIYSDGMFIMPSETIMTPELLKKYIAKHKELIPRYERLKGYYEGEHDILTLPDKEKYKPDNRIVINYAKYIVDTFNGFFSGKPIKVEHPEDNAISYLEFIDAYNSQDDNNSELSKMCDIYGEALEMIFSDEDGNIGIVECNPMNGFIIYDDSIVRKKMYGIRYYLDTDGVECGSFSDKETITYFKSEKDGYIFDNKVEQHYFGDVPMIRYIENQEALGLFEGVISAIDAYNKAISEKANDVEYYADAYLKVLGAKLNDKDMQNLRDNRIINFSGTNADKIVVEFLQKPNADTTQENLLNRLDAQIFQMAMVANINDENFGTQSGISLKYKLQSMMNLANTKQSKFTACMNQRYKMIAHYAAISNKMKEDDWVKIKLHFTRNYPEDLAGETEIAKNLSGITSQQTQLKVLSCVDDVQEELLRIEQEGSSEYDTFTRISDLNDE